MDIRPLRKPPVVALAAGLGLVSKTRDKTESSIAPLHFCSIFFTSKAHIQLCHQMSSVSLSSAFWNLIVPSFHCESSSPQNTLIFSEPYFRRTSHLRVPLHLSLTFTGPLSAHAA